MSAAETPEPQPQEARDRHTVALLHAGDPEGLQQLLSDHGGTIAARLRKDFRRALDDSEIEEAMSAATVRIWKAAGRFDPQKGTLRAWASVIARNAALRILEQRRKALTVSSPNLDQFAIRIANPELPTSSREALHADLRRCIAELPSLQRRILQADLDAGIAVPAAVLANQFGTSTNSVYVSRQKGRKSLLQAMRALGHDLGSPPDEPPAQSLATS